MSGRSGRRPRLALFSYNYAPEPTGIGYYNTDLAQWMQQRAGWQLDVFTGIPHYPWWSVPADYRAVPRREERIAGVAVHRVSHYVPEGSPSGRQRLLLDATWLLAVCWRALTYRQRPDHLLLIAPPFLSGLLGLVLGWWWRRPVWYHIQDLQVDAALDMGMLPRALGRVLLGLESQLLRRVDRLTTISEGMRRRVCAKARRREPCGLLPNWGAVQEMRPWTGANAYRSAWGLSSDDHRVVCMYSGNMGRKQGLDDLIAALDCLDPAQLLAVLAGSGAVRDEVAAALPGLRCPAQLLELQPRSRLREFLAAADIHCLPQKAAMADLVMPSKLLNIMAVGRPVVVAADAGTELARVVTTAGCGLVVPPGDPAAFAAALTRLIQDPALRARCGHAGRAYVCRYLAIDRVLGRFTDELARSARWQPLHEGMNRARVNHTQSAMG